MSEEIFKASLQEGQVNSTKSYEIRKLLYVAFFGGVIPTLVLALKNARWLKTGNKISKILMTTGILAILIKIFIFGNALRWDASLETMSAAGVREARWIMRAISVGFYLVCYYLLKDKYQQHMVTVGETESIMSNGIMWVILGGIIEAVITYGGVFAIGYFI